MVVEFIKDYLSHVRLFTSNARKFLVGSFFLGFGLSVVQLLLNLYLKQLGFEEGRIGSIISAVSIGTMIVAVPAAMLVDRFKIKYILMAAAIIDGGAMMTQAMSTTIWSLRMMSVISGAMFTVHLVASSPFFMRNSSPRERSYLFGVNMAISTFSGFLGSIIGGLVPMTLLQAGVSLLHGYRYALIGGALMAMSASIAYSTIKAKPPSRDQRRGLREYIGSRDWGTTLKLMTPHFVVGMGAGLVIPFLNLYFLKRFELDSDIIGRIFSAGALFTAAGFLIGPSVARRLGLIKTTVISEFLSIPFFLILAFSGNLYLSIAAFLFRGSLMNMSWPLYNNFAMELVSENEQAGTNSLLSLAWNSSWMISANVGGIIIEKWGFTPVMLITVAFYLTATTSAWAFFRKRTDIGRQPQSEIRSITSLEADD